MDCDRIEREGIVERYLAGRLSDDERDAFESHYFSCDRCFEALETAGLIRRGFARDEVRQNAAGARRWSGARIFMGVAAMFLVVIGVVAVQNLTSSAGSPELAALGRVADGALPPYVAMSLRSGEPGDSARVLFERGMDAYTAGDHRRAAELLRAAVRADSSKPPWHLYLGASLLVLGRAEDAAMALRVAAREPDLAAEADLLLARAHLQRGEAEEAQEALDRVVARGGDQAAEAVELRARLERIRAP